MVETVQTKRRLRKTASDRDVLETADTRQSYVLALEKCERVKM